MGLVVLPTGYNIMSKQRFLVKQLQEEIVTWYFGMWKSPLLYETVVHCAVKKSWTYMEWIQLDLGNTCLFPLFLKFFPRAQLQTARPTIPTNTPSIRHGSQTPTAAVYPANQPIMMTMAPIPFASPQPPQYYIPQVTHSQKSEILFT